MKILNKSRNYNIYSLKNIVWNFFCVFQTLIQQARSRVSCVVERRRADEVMDGTGDNNVDNSTDPQRFQRLSGERVAILCESGSPNQE